MNLVVYDDPLLGDDMARVRVRTDVLDQRRREMGFRSAEEFIRKADISRSAWERMHDPSRQEINLRLLANVMRVLNLRFDDLLEYVPDENGIGK